MTTLTIQIPDDEKELFLKFIKKFNGKVVKSPYNQKFVSDIQKEIEERKSGKKGLNVKLKVKKNAIPNKETVAAMEELKAGKGKKFKNVDALFASI
jgi:hypothetical protein